MDLLYHNNKIPKSKTNIRAISKADFLIKFFFVVGISSEVSSNGSPSLLFCTITGNKLRQKEDDSNENSI